ncbi:ATP-binding protein [Pedobacter aquatilis]|uniref:ATP-binding protein n=1 Tax=Pedobacter aquatilis TaxID=351343 RepID=UPI00292E979D|nr:ATP-binding protein [Pedobacter aquatilis]
MNKHISKITSKSIKQSGLPTDYKKAIAEYIWNSFDAGATEVALDYQGNELGRLESFSISDNGQGINIATLNETFGNFLDSNKRELLNQNTFQKGRKGKGRFAFSLFANQAIWKTRFKGPEEKTLSYQINISNAQLQVYETSDTTIAKDKNTGTNVSFYDIFDLSANSLSNTAFIDFLASEFGWYLFLNRDKNYQITISGEPVAYQDRIADSEEQTIAIGEDEFKIVFLRWDQKIGDKYFFYFLNQKQKEQGKKHTLFNNKAIEFHHSLYISSPFFDSFHETKNEQPVLGGFEKNQLHPSYKVLLKSLNAIVSRKEKDYIRDIGAAKLLVDYHQKGIFPDAKDRAPELEHTIKELYCAEPRGFQSSNLQQSKMMVGLINLLLTGEKKDPVSVLLQNLTTPVDGETEHIAHQ